MVLRPLSLPVLCLAIFLFSPGQAEVVENVENVENVERRDAWKKNYWAMAMKPATSKWQMPMSSPKPKPKPRPQAMWPMTKGKGKGKVVSKGKGKGKGKPMAKPKPMGMMSKKSPAKGKGKGKGNGKGKGKGKGKGVIEDCGTCSADCIGVQSFVLVDADTDTALTTILPNEVLDLGALQTIFGATEFAIECITFGPVVSTLMGDNFGTNNTDNAVPWTLSGDEAGDFFPTPLPENLGQWTVDCQPFCELDAMGESAPAVSIDFTVIVPAPTSQPTLAPITPTDGPTSRPTLSPVVATDEPTDAPTFGPTDAPTQAPTADCSSCKSECINVESFFLVDASVNADTPNGGEPQGQLFQITENQVISLDDVEAVHGATELTVVCITNPGPYAVVRGDPDDWFIHAGMKDDRGIYGDAGLLNGLQVESE
jgi:hypothetical protein